MTWIVTIVASLAGAAALIVGTLHLRKSAGAADTSGIDALSAEIAQRQDALEDMAARAKTLAPRSQFEALLNQLEEVNSEIANENWRLKEIESKLDNAQKLVEAKESEQQEVKSAREDDERKLAELMESFQSMSDESIALEQRLAASMKNLDQILSELDLNDDQKAMLNELSEALLAAGSRLRDLITEYGNVNERLKALKQQHSELEEEYTKLVEQQLGD